MTIIFEEKFKNFIATINGPELGYRLTIYEYNEKIKWLTGRPCQIVLQAETVTRRKKLLFEVLEAFKMGFIPKGFIIYIDEFLTGVDCELIFKNKLNQLTLT